MLASTSADCQFMLAMVTSPQPAADAAPPEATTPMASMVDARNAFIVVPLPLTALNAGWDDEQRRFALRPVSYARFRSVRTRRPRVFTREPR